MVAVLVEYIRSLNQFQIEVEVSSEILRNSYHISFLTKKYIDVIKRLIAKLDQKKHTVENIVLLMS